jgi:K+-transporting ATPase ATPase C chain
MQRVPTLSVLRHIWQELAVSIRIAVVFLVVCGICYPLLVWGLGQLFFPAQANGSLLTNAQGQVIGSSLIGQEFTSPQYFHGRPSATLNLAGTPSPYEANNSGASNLGPTNPQLIANVQTYAQQYRKENNLSPTTPLPADAVTASGSGLDPDISPANADLQATRVANTRHISIIKVQQLIQQNTDGRFLGIFGEPSVNVLTLNMALDSYTHNHK